MKIKFEQRWSTIQPISTKQIITSHLKSLNRKKKRHMTLEIQVMAWNRQKNMAGLQWDPSPSPPPPLFITGSVTIVNGIPAHPPLYHWF